jgi:hypothetical protein
MPRVPAISTALPGLTGNVLSTLYVDGHPLEDLQALYDANTSILGGTKWNSPNRFWATPPRRATSPLRDVLEVSMSSPQLVNRYQFLLSHFPCRVWLQYYNAKKKKWMAVRAQRTGKPIQITVRDSVPKHIHADVFDASHRHPQHRGAKHWRTVNIKAKPVRTNKVRMVLTHISTPKIPKNRQGHPVNYSLAVQDFQIGYQVTLKKDVPHSPVITQQEEVMETFASSMDLLGSAVTFGLREYRASDILWGTRQQMEGIPKDARPGGHDIWKCEPQPIPNAVVNLYVDARDHEGVAQQVDRFYLDPVTTGVSANLYYSNDTPDVSKGFEASDESIQFPASRSAGTVKPVPTGIEFPTTFGYLDIDNAMVQWGPTRPWWMGLAFQPQFDSTETNDWVILDAPGIRVEWKGRDPEAGPDDAPIGGITVTIHGATMQRANISFAFNEFIKVVLSWNGSGPVRMAFSDGWSAQGFPPFYGLADLKIDPDTQRSWKQQRTGQLIRLGGYRTEGDADPGRGNYRLMALMLKQESSTAQEEPGAVLTAQEAEFFGTPIDRMMLPPEIEAEEGDDVDHTKNAILRYHPYYQTAGASSENPFGLIGGPGNIYEDLAWTPINRDYRLHRGYLAFQPVHAKYFKFEFTNLAAEPYSGYAPVTRKVKVFTAKTIDNSLTLRAMAGGKAGGKNDAVALGGSGAVVNQTLGGNISFSDQIRLPAVSNPNRSYTDYKPTEALYSADPNTSARLQTLNPLFNLQPWQQGINKAPRFVLTQKHYYETITVEHTSKMAYFVGLKQLRMFKVDYTSLDDTADYIFPFNMPQESFERLLRAVLSTDEEVTRAGFVPDGNWLLGKEGMKTSHALSPDGSAVITSDYLRSQRYVRGLQFATSQSPPRQILSDPDFNDPDLKHWVAYAGAQIEYTGDVLGTIGSTILVTRVSEGSFWNYLEEKYPDWDAIEESDPDPHKPIWSDLDNPRDERSVGGVEGTEWTPVPNRGVVYAAARVYAPTTLQNPLHVQIVSSGGEVLADDIAWAQGGRVTEWFCSFPITTLDETEFRTWDIIEAIGDPEGGPADPARPLWPEVEALGTWNEVQDLLVVGAEVDQVFARLYEEGTAHDSFYVDNLSLFADPILWEFSNDGGKDWWPVYDIRNNPDGVFLFPNEYHETMDPSEGTTLRWRVSGYAPDLILNWLYIRPWYSTLRLGVLPREGLEHGGPNLSPYDQYPSVRDHPLFKTWHKPIPQDWWFFFRQWMLQQFDQPTYVPPAVYPGPYLSDNLVLIPSDSRGSYLTETIVV